MLRINGLTDRKYPNQHIIGLLELDIERGPWICGGAALSLYTKTPVNDIDVYFRDSFSRDATKHRLKLEDDTIVTYDSENAVTLRLSEKTDYDPILHKVQLIKKQNFKTVQEVFDSFDFSVCKIATDGRGNFVTLPRAIADIGARKLTCDNFVADSFINRWAKYTMYGYEMDPETFKQCAKSISTAQFEKIYQFDNAY